MNPNLYEDVNRLINVIIRVLGIVTFVGSIVVWGVTEDHVFEPYVAGGALAMMGVSAVAGAWMDLKAAKTPPVLPPVPSMPEVHQPVEASPGSADSPTGAS